MNNSIKLLVNQKDNNKRIDVFLSEKIKEYTRSYIKKLIKNKEVLVNKSPVTSHSTKTKVDYKIMIKLG